MLYTFLFLVGALHAASVAAQNCNAPQYAYVADYLEDYQPAVRFCASRFGAPTSTVTVTSTRTLFQKRAEATMSIDIHAVADKPKPGSALAIANAESRLRRPSSAKDKRQSGWTSFLSSYWYNQLSKNSQAQSWVRGICSCIVDPVATATTTQVVTRFAAATSTKTSTSSSSSSTSSSSSLSVPAVPAIPSASSTWKSATLSLPTSTSISSLWKSTTLSTAIRSTSIPGGIPIGSAPPSGFPGNNPPPSGFPGSANPPPSGAPVSSAIRSLTSALPSAAPSAPPTPLSPALSASNCVTGAYNGTGACDCSYTIFCGYQGACGAGANATKVTTAASWQACGQTCDNDSECAAWSYSYATRLCTAVVDPACDTDAFETVGDPNGVLGVYEGGCEGVCLV